MSAQIYYPGAIQHYSPWYNDPNDYGRIWPDNVTIAVQHHTDGSEESVIHEFGPNSSRHVSAHLMIARNGKVHQFVSFDKIAWHAGNFDVNVHSIGLEHEQSRMYDTSGNFIGWQDWPDIQLETSARVQNWLKQYMSIYDMEPHMKFQNTECPGDLPVDKIVGYMKTFEGDNNLEWTDPLTGVKILGGMYARWKQIYNMVGPEIYMIIGHPVKPEHKEPDGSIMQEFEHTTFRQRTGSSPERFDILEDIINPYEKINNPQ
jgi:hypothetical protein